jgi:hypothetical protein
MASIGPAKPGSNPSRNKRTTAGAVLSVIAADFLLSDNDADDVS